MLTLDRGPNIPCLNTRFWLILPFPCSDTTGSDVWYLDEVALWINGRRCWLWRAVDQDGYVLDEIVQVRRNAKAARRLVMRLLKKQGMVPRRMITDKLRSYGAAKRQVMPGVEHRSHKSLNNRRRTRICRSKTGTNAPGMPINREPATFCFAVLRRSQSLRSRSHKTFCYPNSQPPTACHGPVESRQRPTRPKVVRTALIRAHAQGFRRVRQKRKLMPALITLSLRSDFELMPPLVVGTALLMT